MNPPPESHETYLCEECGERLTYFQLYGDHLCDGRVLADKEHEEISRRHDEFLLAKLLTERLKAAIEATVAQFRAKGTSGEMDDSRAAWRSRAEVKNGFYKLCVMAEEVCWALSRDEPNPLKNESSAEKLMEDFFARTLALFGMKDLPVNIHAGPDGTNGHGAAPELLGEARQSYSETDGHD